MGNKKQPHNSAGLTERTGSAGFRALLFLTVLALPACAKPDTVYETVYLEKPVPQIFLEPVQKPILEGKTNADLAEYALRLETALDICSAKLSVMADGRSEEGR